MQKFETLAVSAVLFGIATYLINLALGSPPALPTTFTGGLELFIGAVIDVVTFYLLSSGLITAPFALGGPFGTAPAVSGLLLALAQAALSFAQAQVAGSIEQFVGYLVAGALVSLTYFLVQQGLITFRESSS